MSTGPIRVVALPTDLHTAAETAMALALRLVVSGAGRLELLHVHNPGQTVDWMQLPSVRSLLVRWGRLTVDDGVGAYQRLGVEVVPRGLPSLDLVEPLLDALATSLPQLVVLPTEGRGGLARFAEASVAEAVARRLPVPALFVREGARCFVDPDSGTVSLRRVLIPVSSAASFHHALGAAMALVESYDAAPTEFVVVHVGEREAMPTLHLPDDPRWSFRVDVRGGRLETELVSAASAHDVDLIAMSTRGHDELADELRGSHTEVVVRHAPVPVLAVPFHTRSAR